MRADEVQLSHDMIAYGMPVVSMIRFGRHQNVGLSKSQILNILIDGVDSNSYFFHKNCSGGQYKQFLGKGMVDMSWYLPLNKEKYEHPVAFLNLHGDAGQLPEQVKFLTEISSICLVMICQKHYKYSEKDKQLLRSSSASICILNATRNKNKSLAKKFSNLEIIKVPETAPVVYDIIWDYLKLQFKDILKFFSVEDLTKNSQHHHFFLDESSTLHQEGFMLASCMMQHLKENDTRKRDDIFPLQGNLWRSWADLNKEINRQKNRGTINIEDYSHEISKQQAAIRNEQLSFIESMSPLMESFITSLMNIVDDYVLRTYNLQNLILELKKFSATNLTKKVELYKNGQLQAIKDASANIDLKQKIEKEIIQASFGLEHFLREIGQIYEASYEKNPTYCLQLAQIVAQLLIDGYPLELMDGDAAHVPMEWVKAVLQQTINKLGQDHKIYVLSVLGLQSTGKSTMLNTIFGLQFNVSAGRCTRGAFMQMLPLDSKLKDIIQCSYVLIVDTEGLRAFGLDISETQEHDNELATFVIGLANMTIINIYGEVLGDLDDILQTTVHAFLRMNEVQIDCSCHFVHQNSSPNAKSEIERNKFTEKLNKFTQNATKEENCEGKYNSFNDIIKYDDTTDSHFFPGLWKGDPPMAPINIGYSETAQYLKLHLINAICKPSENTAVGLKISSFSKIITDLWSALLKENFVFSFRNTDEISSYNSLEIEYTKWSRKFKQAMLEWEATTGNEISCVDIRWKFKQEMIESEATKGNEISCVDFTKLSSLSVEKSKNLAETVQKHYVEAEMELNNYFDFNKGIIMKWKETFALKLKNEQTVLETQANQQLLQLIEAKKIVSNFEAKNNERVEDFKQSIQESIDSVKEEQKELKKKSGTTKFKLNSD